MKRVIPQMKAITKWNVSIVIPVSETPTMVRYSSFCIMPIVYDLDQAIKYKGQD